MTTRKIQKKKTKRKTILKARRNTQQVSLRSDKADYFFIEAQWYRDQDNLEKALQLLRKALKLNPKNAPMWPVGGSIPVIVYRSAYSKGEISARSGNGRSSA
ncbi:MAG: tetratricopeptide repeat protein [Desulfosarcina sp.]|nr:tetratricopeptide repeat protein [Desulfosarcina sp.]